MNLDPRFKDQNGESLLKKLIRTYIFGINFFALPQLSRKKERKNDHFYSSNKLDLIKCEQA